jgi:competence protein ComEA
VLEREGSRGTLVVWVVAALLVGLVLLRSGGCGDGAGRGSAVRIDRPSGSAAAATGGGAERHGAGIYVHVAGAVRRPGLLRLPEGSRVAEAVDRAGGPSRRAELAGVNLAAELEDGQQVIVPVRGAAGAVATPGAPGSASGSAALGSGIGAAPPGSAGVPKLSLGAATIEQLDQLDGIGPTLAQRIVEYRTAHGGFRSVGELREVEGIGEKRFATLQKALQP